jgi:hypothetical protein
MGAYSAEPVQTFDYVRGHIIVTGGEGKEETGEEQKPGLLSLEAC